ncbi:MAG: PAS domain S-box protein, partial [Campylobacteraceae bacterium]
MKELDQYRNAIENSNIVSKTDIKGIITFVNEEFCKISGYTKEELIGQDHNIVRHPDVPKSTFELLWNTILRKENFKTTAKNRAKNGSTFYVNTTISPILDEDGEIKEFIAIRYDVTENILLTEKLQKKEEELEQLNRSLEKIVNEKTKQLRGLNRTLEVRIQEEVENNRKKDRLLFQQARLASMGEMIGNIAHQWRQPLSELSIILFNVTKLSKKSALKEIEEQYEDGKKVIQKMSNTIEDFRNIFNPEKKKERFNIKDTILETTSRIRVTLKREEIKLSFTCNDDENIFI